MSTALALRPEERQALEVEAVRGADGLAQIEALAVDSPEALAFAGELVVAVKTRWRELEDKRTAVTKPLLEAKRAVDALFGPVQGPLVAAERVLKEKIGAYTVAQRSAQAEAMHAVAAGAPGAALVVPAAPPTGVAVRAVWDFEVVDPAALPRRFLTVDVAAIRRWADMADTERSAPLPIDGVRFFLRGRVAVRS